MKQFAKTTANCLALVIVSPLIAVYGLLVLTGAHESCFEGFSQTLALWPGRMGVYLRKAFYRCVLPHVGDDAWLGFGVLLTSPQTRLGARSYVGPYSILGAVNLDDDVLIASHVSIINGGKQHGCHEVDLPIREQAGVYEPVTIGAGSWIGERAVIMAEVGKHCIVGAGAVVTKPVADYAVVAGVPARVIRFREQTSVAMPDLNNALHQSLSEVASH